SFWGRLGRRMTHARTSTAHQHHHLPASSQQIAEKEEEEEGGEACQFCGHTRMIEFAVAAAAPTDPRAQQHTPPSLSVCENCRRVKNLPAAAD
ncbi:hypothetical protein GGI00_005173, partial [Coemansia sp. RSA 2681]